MTKNTGGSYTARIIPVLLLNTLLNIILNYAIGLMQDFLL